MSYRVEDEVDTAAVGAFLRVPDTFDPYDLAALRALAEEDAARRR